MTLTEKEIYGQTEKTYGVVIKNVGNTFEVQVSDGMFVAILGQGESVTVFDLNQVSIKYVELMPKNEETSNG